MINTECFLPNIKNKASMSFSTTSIQHYTWSSMQYNKDSKKDMKSLQVRKIIRCLLFAGKMKKIMKQSNPHIAAVTIKQIRKSHRIQG